MIQPGRASLLSSPRPSVRLHLRAIRFAGPGSALFAAVLLLAALASEARADRRLFTWTYEPQTMHRGEGELESYTTFSAPEIGGTRGRTATQLQLELEIGMTDRFDAAIYQVIGQDPGGPMKYEGYKVRLRRRLGEGKGRFPLASVAYLEYEGRPDYTAEAVEAKLILGRTLGPFTFALNPIVEFEADGSEWEVDPQYALGLAWRASRLASLGLEARGNEDAHYLGPVIGHGMGDLWVALGSAFRLNDTDVKPEIETRLLLGIRVRGEPEAR